MKNVGLTIMLIGMVLFSFGIFIYVITAETLTEKVDCYDRWNNKIVGQTCLEESIESQGDLIIYFSVIIVVIGFIISMLDYPLYKGI